MGHEIKINLQNEEVIVPEDYNPLEDKNEYMNKVQLAYFKDIIQKWKEELEEKTKKTISHLSENAIYRKSSEEGDITNDEIEILTELRSRDRYRKLIHKIDQSLVKIETGEYGYCEESGDKIGIKRLIARPIATLCLAMQEKHEKGEDIQENAEHCHEVFESEQKTEE